LIQKGKAEWAKKTTKGGDGGELGFLLFLLGREVGMVMEREMGLVERLVDNRWRWKSLQWNRRPYIKNPEGKHARSQSLTTPNPRTTIKSQKKKH
jgi:hypothetical protein